jgi:hypothetical protein
MLELMTAIGSIATPFLVLLLTGVGWSIRSSIERKAKLEEQLRDDRVRVYNEILEPFIAHFAPSTIRKVQNKEDEQTFAKTIASLDHWKSSFKLSLIGSDDVIQSYNRLMQNFFQSGRSQPSGALDLGVLSQNVKLLGNLLLEIRKSMGNEATKLDSWNMLEWFIMDIDKLRNAYRE